MAEGLLARRAMAQRENRSTRMKMPILVEGKTERAFKVHMRDFLKQRLPDKMPRLDMFPYDGRIPKEDKLRRIVENLLTIGQVPANAVIARTDVYTRANDFVDA